MKRLLSMSAFWLLISMQSVDAQLENNCPGYKGKGIEIFSYQESKKLVKNYWQKFDNSELFTRAIYFDYKTFWFIDSFFIINKTYSGLQMYFSISNSKLATDQKTLEQFLVFLAPAKEDAQKKMQPDFQAFETFYNSLDPGTNPFNKKTIDNCVTCPRSCDSSMINWVSSSFRDINRLEKINTSGNYGTLFNNINDIIAGLGNYEAATEPLERGKRKKKFTQSMYFERSKFERLSAFFKEYNPSVFPAVGLYFQNYKKRMDEELVKGQSNRNQITAGFVPMQQIGKYLEPDPCTYIKFITDYLPKGGSDNHGTLCPNLCPPGGN